MVNIFVDTRESRSFYELGCKLLPEHEIHYITLNEFDIIIGNKGEIGIEIKRKGDLPASVIDKTKRFENQSTRMAEFREKQHTHCYFFLEDRYKDLSKNPYYSWLTPEIWTGILASICEPKDMKIIPVDDDEMIWMQVAALIRKFDNKQPLKHVPITPTGETVTTRMLQGITGLGEVRARAIAEMFNIKELCLLDAEDLQQIEGIGPVHAQNIIKGLEGIG